MCIYVYMYIYIYIYINAFVCMYGARDGIHELVFIELYVLLHAHVLVVVCCWDPSQTIKGNPGIPQKCRPKGSWRGSAWHRNCLCKGTSEDTPRRNAARR